MRQLSFPIFGPALFHENIAEIAKYAQEQNTSFREARTDESIQLASLGLSYVKSGIINPHTLHLQLGRIVKGPDGIYINPHLPIGKDGRLVLDEQLLREQRDKAAAIHEDLRIGDNGFSFVEYGFPTGPQDAETFVSHILAKGLEHTRSYATNLANMANKRNYSGGVNVFGYNPAKGFVESVACLDSSGSLCGRRLDVGGYWDDGGVGYAFGIVENKAGAQH